MDEPCSAFDPIATAKIEDPKNVTRCTNSVMAARYLERSADHAFTIAEATILMQTGERVEIRSFLLRRFFAGPGTTLPLRLSGLVA